MIQNVKWNKCQLYHIFIGRSLLQQKIIDKKGNVPKRNHRNAEHVHGHGLGQADTAKMIRNERVEIHLPKPGNPVTPTIVDCIVSFFYIRLQNKI